jgi:DNA-binding PadR family transcriptional regulator
MRHRFAFPAGADPHWAPGRGPGFHARSPGQGPAHGGGRPGDWGGRGFGGPPGFGRRRRLRRGDVRAAILVMLDEEPRNGYGLMQEIEARSEGAWRPSPGSVYPALALLEDEGLVRAEDEAGRKQFALTDEGRAYVAEHREALGTPWANLEKEGGSGRREIRDQVGQVAAAAMQVAALGNDDHIEKAKAILLDARRALYRLLAEEDEQE